MARRRNQGGFVPVQKNRAYFKRYQVKFRRRREGKTNYARRKKLVAQNMTKYNVPKYRFVVRKTNKQIICQVVYSKLIGDQVLCAAYSSELARYGVKGGLSNYAASYCTGLLLARRLLKQLGMDTLYQGVREADGDYFVVDWDSTRRPFQCYLDVGLARTTTGANIFGALKGAVDGGLYVPHSAKRFPGFENGEYNPEAHRARIFAEHVSNYMQELSEADPKKFQSQFSVYVKAGINADNLEDMYKQAHSAIRANPARVATEKKRPEKPIPSYKRPKMSYKEKKYRVQQKKAALERKIAAQA
uniref:Large ribosomal subunit protein uL18 C-terminal eukaryotes domain-containing protein n=1 Tax=Percolomonas cosmopolitus TaxID=63605 RepID=A0A7S1KPQ7_9EUKA